MARKHSILKICIFCHLPGGGGVGSSGMGESAGGVGDAVADVAIADVDDAGDTPEDC